MTRTSEPGFEEGTLNAFVVQPREIKAGDRYGYKCVAIIHEGWNGWAAYSGPTSWTDDHVARNGDQLTYAAAEALFPSMAATGRVYAP